MDFVRSYFFQNALLGGCYSKATPNPIKSDDKNGQEMFKLVRVAFGKK